MTLVMIDLQDGAGEPLAGVLEWSPTSRYGTGPVVLPSPVLVPLVEGAASVELEPTPTDGAWVWRVVERIPGGSGLPRYVRVPDDVDVLYGALVEVDVETLSPVVPASSLALIAALEERVAALEGIGVGPIGYVQLDTGAPVPSYAEGRLFWDAVDHTLAVQTGLDAVTLQTGQEVLLRVRNNTGATIPNGAVVRITGASGDRPTVALAAAGQSVAGVATMAIPQGQDGFVCVFGIVRDIDTSAFAVGSVVYASAVPGGLASSGVTEVGLVTRSHGSQGALLVRVRG